MSIKIFHNQPVKIHGEVREFSLEEHGDNFREIASEYAKTNANNVKDIVDTDSSDGVLTDVNPLVDEKPSVKPRKGKKSE